MKKILFTALFCALCLTIHAQGNAFNVTEDEALAFLYRSMPTPDSVDYSEDFYRTQIRTTLQARNEMPWGQKIPKREWMHFVLPIRVNNENLDNFRAEKYAELKQRVQGLTMEQAALEVNHWCHEHVTYQPSDVRTSSPLASMRSAIGRCGEESTFTVAAMRTVGIPARQVYTPRWAHTDDNHAWVEVWIDGEWKFLGACEPEPVLNLGWFNAPASRAMLMHTKAFGHYDGPERVMTETPCYTEIDVTDTYAPTSVFKVQVVDTKGRPVKATVQFRLYNYAEFYPLNTKQTNAKGQTDFKAGHGDLLVWATDGKAFGFEKVHVGQTPNVRITLKYTAQKISGKNLTLDVTPPAERNTIPTMTDEQIAQNKERLSKEDEIRGAYTSTFINEPGSFLQKARGNHQTIRTFLDEADDQDKAQMLLSLISEKDLRDVSLEVLRDHYLHTRQAHPYTINPRVSNEMLTPYRGQLQRLIPEADQQCFRHDPNMLAQWIEEHITIDETHNPQALCMHPVSAYKTRRCDTHSRDILFVAMARSLDIEARIDEVTGKVQWREGDNAPWQTVLQPCLANSQTAQGQLTLTYEPQAVLSNPKYYIHFTLSKIEDGMPVLLNYPEEATFETDFSHSIALDEGTYQLTTGTRLAKGGVLTHLTFFTIRKGQTTTLPLVIRQSTDEVQVIGGFGSETRYTDPKSTLRSLLSTTGRGYYVIGLLSAGTEPTNHAMNDLSAVRTQLQEWDRPIMLICKDASEMEKIQKAFPNLPSTVHFGIDSTGQIAEGMKSAVQGEPATQLPTFLIADTFDRVVFMRQGYTINLGDQILKVAAKLK